MIIWNPASVGALWATRQVETGDSCQQSSAHLVLRSNMLRVTSCFNRSNPLNLKISSISFKHLVPFSILDRTENGKDSGVFSRNMIVPVQCESGSKTFRFGSHCNIGYRLQPNLDHHNVERKKCARGNGRLTCQILFVDVDASKSLNLADSRRSMAPFSWP